MNDDAIKRFAEQAAKQLGKSIGRSVALERWVEVPGAASLRRYVRLCFDQPVEGVGETAMMVILGPDPLGSEEGADGERAAVLPFTEMQSFLLARSVPVPRILVDAWQDGYQVLEDLGDLTLKRRLESLPRHEWLPALEEAVELLVCFQEGTWTRPDAGCSAYRRGFDRGLLRWELDHFREWLLDEWSPVELSPAARRTMEAGFDDIADELAGLERRLVHRDFQSTNLMLTGRGMVLIDFQDALLGPEPYDLVAFLRDSYIELSEGELDHLLALYLQLRQGSAAGPAHPDFVRLFHLQTVQRKLKDAGRFVFIDREKNNPSFLPFIEPSLRYVAGALDRLPGHGRLMEVLAPVLYP